MTAAESLGTKDPVAHMIDMAGWVEFLNYAIAEKNFHKQFMEATGLKYNPPKCGLDSLIDEATGLTKTITMQFVKWATESHWGHWPQGAEELRKACEKEQGPQPPPPLAIRTGPEWR